MKNFSLFLSFVICTLSLITIVSCSDDKRAQQAQAIVINELMTSNRTGLQNHKGKPKDWVELKNTGADSINLKGFKLAVIKEIPDSTSDKKVKEEETTWKFPDVTIHAGENLVVFADKKKDPKDKKKDNGEDDEAGDVKEEKEKKVKKDKKEKVEKSLTADLNLPKEGATLRFLSPGGKVIKELKYGKMSPDQSLALRNDSTYVRTYMQSPGFNNDRKGYEFAIVKIDEKRCSPLLIWEVMSRSAHSYENWVELKNVSNQEIDLSQYSLSKKKANKDTWKLPARKLQPGEIVTVQLAGKRSDKDNALQAPFKLGSAETIILSKDGKFVDGVCAKATSPGSSIGRVKDQKGLFFFAKPTKNSENNEKAYRYIADTPEFDKAPGVYPGKTSIVLKLKDNSRKVHYTVNGSEPTFDSPVIKDSLALSEGTVVRTLAEGDSTTLRSRIGSNTYILDARHNMPVMSISVNEGDLYNYENGIYADGPGATGSEWPYMEANYWKPWTKKAHVEFFDDREGKEGFSVDCGLKIFGGFSRAEKKKSFRLKFRGLYGDSEVDYDFFDKGEDLALEDLVVRSGSQDWNRCMVRDEFFTTLLKKNSPTLLIQDYRPVALYINGKYFGLYYLRDKIDTKFVARKLDLPNDSINILMSVGYNEAGPKEPYQKLMSFVQNNDMKEAKNYEYMRNNVDLQGLIDYKLGEIFSGNSDVGNIRYVRSTHPKSDKKWRFVFYDLDATWVGLKTTARFYLAADAAAEQSNVKAHNIMINRLLENKDFRNLFLERLSYHLANTFAPKNTEAHFDNLVAQIKPEMKRNCERWPSLSYSTWEKNIADFRAMFKEKPKVMLNEIREYLGVTDAENKKYFSKLGY